MTPRFAASHLELFCLPKSHKRTLGLKGLMTIIEHIDMSTQLLFNPEKKAVTMNRKSNSNSSNFLRIVLRNTSLGFRPGKTHTSLCFFFFCFFVLLNVPVNNFSVILGRSLASWVFTSTLGTSQCIAQGHYTAVVGFEPRNSPSGVRSYTTEPPRHLPAYVAIHTSQRLAILDMKVNDLYCLQREKNQMHRSVCAVA